MRFILNKFPEDKNFEPNDEWTPLKEPKSFWDLNWQAVPFMVINVLLMLLLLKTIGISFKLNTVTTLVSFCIFVPFHELLHALFYPENIMSKNIYFGFYAKALVPFVSYTGEIKRNTYIRVYLAPLVIITILGLLFLLFWGSNQLVEHIVVLNALGSCADCLSVFLILRQIPKNAILRSKKWKTYYKC